MSSSEPLRLDYAPPPSMRWKKTLLRGSFIVAAIIVGYFAWKYLPPLIENARILYVQRQCLTYEAPSDMVVYEEEPVAAAALRAKDGNYAPHTLRRPIDGKTPPKPTDAAAYTPPCWRKLLAFFPSRKTPGAIIFLHERTTASGPRLVCIRYFPESFSFTAEFLESYNVVYSVVTPGNWATKPQRTNWGQTLSVDPSWPRQPPLVRVYAGQPDANNSAKFSIRYEMWGQTDTLDGMLKSNDSIVLTPRNKPKPP